MLQSLYSYSQANRAAGLQVQEASSTLHVAGFDAEQVSSKRPM